VVKTVALQEEPDVSSGLTVAMARQMKIFGTVKSFKVNPRGRVDQVPLVDKTPAPQSAYSAPAPAPAPVAPTPVVVKPAVSFLFLSQVKHVQAAAAVVVASSQPQTSKPRAPAGNSIRDLMNRFQTVNLSLKFFHDKRLRMLDMIRSFLCIYVALNKK
jgi:hypothetical protein